MASIKKDNLICTLKKPTFEKLIFTNYFNLQKQLFKNVEGEISQV